jgi:hypothetical protein
VYRVEASLPGAIVPWIVSNPIVVGTAGDPPANPDEATPRIEGPPVVLSIAARDWAVEHDPPSAGQVSTADGALQFGFKLGPGEPGGQFAAISMTVGSEVGADRLQFLGRASRPMRLSVQVRLPDQHRWRRSVYLDTTPRLVRVGLEEFDPVDVSTTQRPIVARIHTLLFVVDTLNTPPGAEGTIWISDVVLGTRKP